MSSAPTPEESPALDPSVDDLTLPVERSRRRSVAPSRVSFLLVAILTGSALFMGGFTLGAHVSTTPGTPADQEARFAAFWDVYGLINSDFAGSPKPSQDALVQAAIKGMMEGLNDQWSYYQGPDDFASSLLNVGGQAEGIGVQVQLQPVDPTSTMSCDKIGGGCELAIIKPITGSPAAAAGIQPGDVILRIDNTTIQSSVDVIRATKGLVKSFCCSGVTLGSSWKSSVRP